MNGKSTSENGEKDMREDIRYIRNNIERIKSDTHNINRIMTLANIDTILNDLKNLVGKSEVKAAILYLTREKISRQQLAQMLGLDPRNLPKFINPFVDHKTYITELREDGRMYYQRSEILDLIGFEQQEAFAPLIASWTLKQSQQPDTVASSVQEPAPPKDTTGAAEPTA